MDVPFPQIMEENVEIVRIRVTELGLFLEPSLMRHHDTSTLMITVDCRCTCSVKQ